MHPSRFAPGVELQHRRLDPSNWNDIYVVGDVHGCRPTLDRLLDELDPRADDLVVFVGDLVRRGPDNHGVVDRVRSSSNMLAIRGNNEEKLLRGRKTADDLTTEDLRYLRSLPVAISWGGHLVVHGGVDPRKPLADHTVDDLQNTEELDGDGPFWWEQYAGPERIFFGHKVLADPLVSPSAVGLDTGCVYGGALTAYDCTRDRTVSITPDERYRERRPEKFLQPSMPANQ